MLKNMYVPRTGISFYHFFLRMKLTAVLLTATFLHLNATVHSQNISVETKNATLKYVFRAITKQTGYAVFYNDYLLANTKPVTVNAKNMSLQKFLDILFTTQPLQYELRHDIKTIILSRKPILITPKQPVTESAENVMLFKKITGQVVDDEGKPIKGASVLVDNGKRKGAITNDRGEFSIDASEGDMLIISSIGYKSQSIKVEKQNTIQVVLEASINSMNEVVVIGYGTQLRRDLTGSVGTIKGNDLQKSKSISFTEAMQGRLAGLQVTSSSGEPGASVNVSIRGSNSFTSGVQPLYVIDGVQIDVNSNEVSTSSYGNTAQMDPLSSINPSDIASIEVLKDASATAIYGSRGANGVIIVTTKTGSRNFSSLELNMYAGLSVPSKKIPVLNAVDYATYRYANSPTDPLWATDSDGDGVLDAPKDYSDSASYNWQDLLMHPALSQNYNVNYSGGNNKTSFSSSLGYLNQDGLIRKNKYQRFNANLNLGYNATTNFKITSRLNASYMESTGVVTNGGDGPRGWNGVIQNMLLYKPTQVPDPGGLELDPENSALGSPLDFVNYAQKRIPTLRIITSVAADYKIGKDISLNTNFGGMFTNSRGKEWYPSTTPWGYSVNGMAIVRNDNTSNWYNTTTATYRHIFNKVHNLTAMAGFEVNSYIYENFNMRTSGFDIQSINGADNIATGKVQDVPATTNKYKYNRISQFGRINYILSDKYLFTGTIRNDGSSKFGSGNKYALFPSAAFAWRASRESFLKKSDIISDLKLRTSFGITGNDRIAAYQSLSGTEAIYVSSSGGGVSLGIVPSVFANPGLKWESTHQYDGGLDISLLKDRITITADVYLKQTKDLLLNANIPGQSGFSTQWQNIGRVDNKGFEITLNTINIKKQDFTWSTNFNLSSNRNEIKSLGAVQYVPFTLKGGAITNAGRLIVGHPIGIVYGYEFDGIYQKDDFVTNQGGTVSLKPGVVKMQNRNAAAGDFKYKDLNGDGVINDNDMTVIGNTNPKHYGGLSNTFVYKNIDLSVLLNWSYGNDILYAGKYRIEAGGGVYANVSQTYWENRWTPEHPTNEYASLVGQGKNESSSYYVEDGSYMRLKNVTIGYSFKKLLGLKDCRAYITAENLLTWTKYTGYDPEISSYNPALPGVDNISYPRARTFTFGLNLKF